MRKIFRNLISQEEATKRFHEHAPLTRMKPETVPLKDSLGRVLAKDIYSPINVPPFDRASMDGFAVRANDTIGAEEDNPIKLEVVGELKAGYTFDKLVGDGQAVEISTGAPMPTGADSVVMIEYCERENDSVLVYRASTPGKYVMAAGADIEEGERIISNGIKLSSRELGVLSAMGINEVNVFGKPKVGIFSSGDEIISPGEELKPGKLFDINSTSIGATVEENGGEPHFLGILEDKKKELEQSLAKAIREFDLVVISGGTSAGMGDILYRVIDELGEPGLLVHGVKVKPGKPTILAVCNGVPVIGLPGYPASALSIFQLFVQPYIRQRAGLSPLSESTKIKARVKQRIQSVGGRHEFKPVYLLKGQEEWLAYPVPGGSGAITSVALADGFLEIPEFTDFVDRGDEVTVSLLSKDISLPDIQIIGSHDLALAKIQGLFEENIRKYKVRSVGVGSMGGVSAIRRGEAHIAGVHIFDKEKGYNQWLKEEMDVTIVPGYYRMQGLYVQKNNPKDIKGIEDLTRDDIKMINRNPGSGTRILMDQQINEHDISMEQIQGYKNYTRSHSTAAEAVRKGIVDVAPGIEIQASGLDFIPLTEEEYDLIVSKDYENLEAVKEFVKFFQSSTVKDYVDKMDGYRSKS